MTYAELCADNKYLYGRLEKCAVEIKKYKDAGKKRQARELQPQYNSIKKLIDINLDMLEACWTANEEMYIQVTNESELMASKKDAAIINVFLDNPDKSVEEIAFLTSVHKSTAARVISDWYRQNYGKEVATVSA